MCIGRPRDNPKQSSRVGGGRLCTVEEFDDLTRTPGLAGDRLRESVREPIGTPIDVSQPLPKFSSDYPCFKKRSPSGHQRKPAHS